MVRLFLTDIDTSTGGNRREAERMAIRRLLGEAVISDVVIDHHPDGAPYIAGHPELHISISHSSTTCLLAVSDRPIGVDIESPRPQLARVAHKFLMDEESARLDRVEERHTYIHELLRYWTAKEATFKLLRLPDLTVSAILVSPDGMSASCRGQECFISYTTYGTQLIAIASHESGIEYSLHYVH